MRSTGQCEPRTAGGGSFPDMGSVRRILPQLKSNYENSFPWTFNSSQVILENPLEIFSKINYTTRTFGDIAQLVEHLVRNQRVTGSTPAISKKDS